MVPRGHLTGVPSFRYSYLHNKKLLITSDNLLGYYTYIREIIMDQKKAFFEDYLGSIASSMSGYSPAQIRDMKSNKIALNAYGEPVC